MMSCVLGANFGRVAWKSCFHTSEHVCSVISLAVVSREDTVCRLTFWHIPSPRIDKLS